MKKNIYEGKTLEEVKNKALEELETTENNVIINVLEEKNGLLKKNVKIEVITYNEIINFIKENLTEIIKLMNLTCNLEVRKREKTISIKIFSDNNSILIGKNGKNIQALQTIIRQIVSNEVNKYITIILDVENYKEKRVKHIEILAKKMAKEVISTGCEIKLDNMNSYERRIVHSALTNNKKVYTESVGEEPNRCVVIKLK